jgi:transcription antitermination factor NusG
MSSELHDGAWVAVYTHAGCEKLASESLRQRGYEVFLPTYPARGATARRKGSIDRVLFPGYLFCRYMRHPTYRILDAPYALRLVGFHRQPTPIPEHEVAWIRSIVDSGVYSEPWKYLTVGTAVAIKRGPLRGLEGILIDTPVGTRLVLSVALLQRAVAVEVDARDVIQVNDEEMVNTAISIARERASASGNV